jgi:maltooligosyltrehalose trehalohydrolase
MPFGAEVRRGQGVRFRLWAPEARQVELCLADGRAPIPLAPDGDGWVECVVREAGPGTRYRYRIDGSLAVPDPASRFQPEDVHGPSEVIDPAAFAWTDGAWQGRPWEELVFYELHVGTFTPEGTLRAAMTRLDYLADLGITAVELMPVADSPGRWNWGYDGVLLFAVDSAYGRPEDLKTFVQACHARGLAVFLDVVYNHFGPEGNYLGLYAPQFFNARHRTPWGDAINYDGPGNSTVRAFFRENACYWLEEYHFDGLRLDAVHAICDDSPTHILEEIAAAVHAGPGAGRRVHLVLENDANEARFLRPDGARRPPYVAQWNDDIHHVLHVACSGERTGYYADYPDPVAGLARSLTEGFVYQGDHSEYRGHARGESTAGVPLTAFVAFLQNHDQTGNRAFGERLTALAPAAAVRAATAVIGLAPAPPMLFMGEEWAARQPFLFFCDFGPDLAQPVVEGRRREFARFPEFRDPKARERIPDPQDPATRARSILGWDDLLRPEHRGWWEWTRGLLRLRQAEVVPRLTAGVTKAEATRLGAAGLAVEWQLGQGSRLRLAVNLGAAPLGEPLPWARPGRRLFETAGGPVPSGGLGPWHAAYYVED